MSVAEETVEIRSNKSSPNTSIAKPSDLELLMEALNCLETPEQRIAALCKKYSDLLEDRRIVAKHLKQTQKELKSSKVELEKEAKSRQIAEKLATNHKATASKLESLCRELQNQNRSMKQDLVQTAKSEEGKRKQLINKFQGSLEGITKQLDKNSETNENLRNDNQKLSDTLGQVGDQYKQREEQFNKALAMMREREGLLEQKMNALEEARKGDGEKLTQTLTSLMEKTQMVINLSQDKDALQKQVQYYSERFEDFNDTLTKSNEAITSFSSEMGKLQKVNHRLEKNAEEWKLKHYKCQQQLIVLTESTLKQTEKNDKLENLCRALQERQNTTTNSTTATADE